MSSKTSNWRTPRIREAFERFAVTIGKYHGRVRELRGDALLAEFERASDAVTASLAFQEAEVSILEAIADGVAPRVRIGIAMGEVVIAAGTITGAGVVLAQRLEQLAEPGAVVIQGAAYEGLVRSALQIEWFCGSGFGVEYEAKEKPSRAPI